ncbi:hypothetical protein AAG742_00055 [Micrococcus sp. 2A]|uniref:hypothetical protein n=1 Tax=Micrococcus TaxID=1269 RepID=UPI0020032F48|nr:MULTISPECIES: hypothetical protein [unclassified Micrococcus]MCK6095548.1 hypothetical protein [Micrococcus sp. EYE_212]MCK6171623.1 hypothetical protein [Micrococcus sp. EYE_162]
MGGAVVTVLGLALPAWGVLEAWTGSPLLGRRDRRQVTLMLLLCGAAWWSAGRVLLRPPRAAPPPLHGPPRSPEEEAKRRRMRLAVTALLAYAVVHTAWEATPGAPVAAGYLAVTGGLVLWAGLVMSLPGVAAWARRQRASWTGEGRAPDTLLTVPGTSVVHFVDRSARGGRTGEICRDGEGPAGADRLDRPAGPS